MRYLVLACDYDGTLALDGRVEDKVVEALNRLLTSGRKLVLVTGRQLDDLLRIFPHIQLFERVVAENGALLYTPATREVRLLAERPPEALLQALRGRGVQPLAVGRAVVATRHPQEEAVLEAIRLLGLEYQVIFNKGAVMILPTGINKATGLKAALAEMGLSIHNTAGIGDAENDHAFLRLCECSGVVANALPKLKERADFVTEGDHGEGVIELIGSLLASDLRELEPRLTRHHIPLGKAADGAQIALPPYGTNFLLAGTSGSGKSTLATGFLERLMEKEYQVCILDPEGDYSTFEKAVVLGSSQAAPAPEEALKILEQPAQNLVLNILGIARENRPAFVKEFLPRLMELRARTGRPHWIVLDETHHLFPSSWDPASLILPQEAYGILLVTVHPEHVARAVLALAKAVIVVGEAPEQMIRSFSDALGRSAPPLADRRLASGEAFLWQLADSRPPVRFRSIPPRTERLRHRRKYAEGELSPEGSFYFRGPEGKLNLRAQNLSLFLQIAEGVDDATWLHHLRRGEYSRWFREFVKDEELAGEAEKIELQAELDPAESRRRIREAIEKRYTSPA